MYELILSLSDFLETDAFEEKTYKYKGDVGCKSDITVSFKAVKMYNDKVYISGKIKGFLYLECSRCLSFYAQPVHIDINTELDIIDEKIDVGEELRQLLILEMPMKPVCSKDCLGICKICGRYNKKNNSCFCNDLNDDFIKERWEEMLNIGGSKNAKSKKKTHPSS
jgi:uncharacterized protein